MRGSASRGGASQAAHSQAEPGNENHSFPPNAYNTFFRRMPERAMAVPRIAIVGRPNVGKSSLFNWLAGRRIAIVEPTAGVTRDRVTAPVELGSGEGTRYVEITDTGGMGI